MLFRFSKKTSVVRGSCKLDLQDAAYFFAEMQAFCKTDCKSRNFFLYQKALCIKLLEYQGFWWGIEVIWDLIKPQFRQFIHHIGWNFGKAEVLFFFYLKSCRQLVSVV